MERQPQNPEFRNNPENFHPCFEHPKKYVNFHGKENIYNFAPKIFALYLDEWVVCFLD